MGGIHAVRNLAEHLDRTLDGQSSFASEKLVQGLAFDILHHKIENAIVGLAKIGDANCVRMLDGGRRLSLALESRDRLAFLEIVAVQHVLSHSLYRNVSRRKLIVPCKIDLSHGTFAKASLEQITVLDQLSARQGMPRLRLISRTHAYFVGVADLTFWALLHKKTERTITRGFALFPFSTFSLFRFRLL